jgi:putative transcriptional regulator
MDIKVIRWKLNELMARKRVKNKDLAEALGITENSVYRLRKTDAMPRLSPERLDGICDFLNCQPGDLLERVPNGTGDRKTDTVVKTPRLNKKTINDISSSQGQDISSLSNCLIVERENPIDVKPSLHPLINEEAA